MPAQTITAGNANLSPSRATKLVAGLTKTYQTFIRRNFFVNGVNATIHVAIRPSIVE